MKTLGLSMIVKNEEHVILRLLNSVCSIIDYWVIVDTGSTDSTKEIIKEFFKEKNIPGQLLEVEWRDDFSYVRNISLDEIEKHVDYGIWIDADEEIIINRNIFDKEKMLEKNMDSISIETVYGKIKYTRKSIWRTGIGEHWEGPIHELLSSSEEKTGSVAVGIKTIVRPEGNSWKQSVEEKYSNHARILEKYVNDTGMKDPRWVFYTAQSYRDSKQYEKSIEWYKKRADMKGGFFEEIYVSKFMVAKISEAIGKSKDECLVLYNDAHESDPIRGEAIKGLIQMYHRAKDYENAYIFSLYGLRYNRNNPYPHRILFLDNNIYDYEMLELHSVSCFYTNRIEEGSKFYWMMREQLDELGEGYLSSEAKKRVMDNERFFPLIYAMPVNDVKKEKNMNGVKASGRKNSNVTKPKKRRR